MSEIAEIDADRALELLEQVVAARGEDFTYVPSRGPGPSCAYVRNGRPSCLVAQALTLHGWSLGDLEGMDTHPDGYIFNLQVDGNLPHGITYRAAKVFVKAQDLQDKYETWGTALAAATQFHASYLTEEMSGESDDN